MKIWILLFSCLAFATVLTADQDSLIRPEIGHVALFKNGLGYFSSSVTAPEKNTLIQIADFPVPSLGTFWISYPEDVVLRSVKTAMEETSDERPANNLMELLAANSGKQVVVHTSLQQSPVLEGTLLQLLQGKPPSSPSPYIMDTREPRNDPYVNMIPSTQMLLLKTSDGTVAVNASAILGVDFKDKEVKTLVTRTLKRPLIRIELEKPSPGKKIQFSFLARGISWSPAYQIDLSDKATAHLSAQALILNEVVDLANVPVDLVTGFPNLQFADMSSPIAMNQTLAEFLQGLGTRRDSESRNMIGQQMAYNTRGYSSEAETTPRPGYSTALAGQVVEDLFLYPAGNLNLRRGETAYIPLFSADVPYERLYTWKIADLLDTEERYAQNPNTNRPPEEEVWNTCRITNAMKIPWTTAPVVFVRDGQIIGEDTGYYTAPGTVGTIRINRALNIAAEQQEFEIERQRDAMRLYGYSYDLVKLRGELKIHNQTSDAVTIEVTKELSGEVQQLAPAGKDVATPKGLRKVNPHHVLTWRIQLQAGQDQTLTYAYSVQIRN